MKLKTTLLSAAALLALCGCGGNDTSLSSNTTIDVAGAIADLTPLKVSDLGKSVRYLPLETNDSSLVGSRWKILPHNDIVLVINTSFQDAGAGILCFDIHTGKFIGKIGHRGQDPEAYETASPAISEDGKHIYLPANGNRLLKYAPDGKLEEMIDFERKPATWLGIFDGDTIISPAAKRADGLTVMEEMTLTFYQYVDRKTTGDSCAVLPGIKRQKMPDVSDIKSISVYSGDGVMRNSSGAAAAINIVTSSGTQLILSGNSWLRNVNGTPHYHEAFCDTIFNAAPGTGSSPAYVFDMGENGIQMADLGREELKTTDLLLTDVIETPALIAFGLTQGWMQKDDHKEYVGLFDKRTGTTRMTEGDKGFADDLTGFMHFYPLKATPRGALVGALTIDDIDKYFEENPDADRPAWLDDQPDDMNPVLVIVE